MGDKREVFLILIETGALYNVYNGIKSLLGIINKKALWMHSEFLLERREFDF